MGHPGIDTKGECSIMAKRKTTTTTTPEPEGYVWDDVLDDETFVVDDPPVSQGTVGDIVFQDDIPLEDRVLHDEDDALVEAVLDEDAEPEDRVYQFVNHQLGDSQFGTMAEYDAPSGWKYKGYCIVDPVA